MVVRYRDLRIKYSEFPELTRRISNDRSWNRIGRLGAGCVGLGDSRKTKNLCSLSVQDELYDSRTQLPFSGFEENERQWVIEQLDVIPEAVTWGTASADVQAFRINAFVPRLAAGPYRVFYVISAFSISIRLLDIRSFKCAIASSTRPAR
jgi:hypothetical protein